MSEEKSSLYRIKSASRSYQLIISNNSGYDLKCTASHLDHGEWSDNGTPQYIPFNHQGGFMAESDGACTGTQGEVTYELVGGNSTLSLTFDVPYDGGNSSTSTLSGDSSIKLNPGANCPGGDNPTDNLTLQSST